VRPVILLDTNVISTHGSVGGLKRACGSCSSRRINILHLDFDPRRIQSYRTGHDSHRLDGSLIGATVMGNLLTVSPDYEIMAY